jgi:predicted TIM-barrel fold metal-dependent hydrolase
MGGVALVYLLMAVAGLTALWLVARQDRRPATLAATFVLAAAGVTLADWVAFGWFDLYRYLPHLVSDPQIDCALGELLADILFVPSLAVLVAARLPGRIVALRIHVNRKRGVPPTKSGAIRDRDLSAPEMAKTWAAAREMGIAIQMHLIPCHAPQIEALAARFPDVPVILDHLARAGEGTPAEFDGVLKMARLPRVYMKFSGVNYSSKEPFPHRDAKPVVRRAFDAFGPRRMLWGGLGMNMAQFRQAVELFDEMLYFASAAEKARIRGGNAMELYGFSRA